MKVLVILRVKNIEVLFLCGVFAKRAFLRDEIIIIVLNILVDEINSLIVSTSSLHIDLNSSIWYFKNSMYSIYACI